MTTDELERELADDLKEDARENIAMEGADDEEKRDKSMENIAHSIAKAIKNGEVSLKKATPKELNELADKDELVLWLVDGDGVLAGEPPLAVTDKDIVRWDATRWTLFAKGGSDPSPTPTIDAYTKAETDSRINSAVGAEASRASSREGSLALAINSLRSSVGGLYNSEVEGVADETSVTYSTSGRVKTFVVGLATSIKNKVNAAYAHIANMVNTLDDSATHYPTTHAVTAAIGAEATARESADSALDARIDGEETAREQADSELQAQIDAISSKSDVVDVVASYVELIAYDTSAIGDNDVIKVLEDETHDDAESYYRWNLTTQTWGYIGSQGPFVTPSEMQTALNGKVDKVAGKGLSTNDYTTAEKNKLAGIEAGADKSHVKFFSYTADYADIAAAMPYANYWYNVFLVGKEDGTYPRSYALVKFDRTNEEMVFVAMRNDSTLCTITKKRSLGTGWTYHDYPLAPQSHASSDTTYGTGDATHYGHVKVDSSLSDTSTNPVQNKIVTNTINASAPYIIDAASATTAVFDEAVSRYNAGKLVFIRSSPYILQCVGATSAQMLFESVAGATNGISKGVIDWRRGASVPSITWLNAAARDGSNATGTWGINISGNAASATHLSTPRNLKVNLASESARPFDGSTNAESIGVSDALPIPHGGTGATTAASALTNLGLGNFSPGTRIGLYGLEILTTEVVDIALSDKVYDTTLFVEYCRSSSDADGHHPELLAISFRYIEDEDDKWVSTPRMAVLYSFNAAGDYFKPELKYTADGHILLNLSASRRHAGQVTIIASSANCSFITVSKLAMSSSVWTGATAVTDVRVNAIDDAVVHKEGDETITGVKTVSTSGKVGFIVQDDKDTRLRAQQTGVSNRYIQLDVESGDEGDNVAVYARNGNTNGSYLVSIDSSTVNTGGRGVCGLGQKTDTVVRLGSKKLDFSGTLGTDSNTLYFV